MVLHKQADKHAATQRSEGSACPISTHSLNVKCEAVLAVGARQLAVQHQAAFGRLLLYKQCEAEDRASTAPNVTSVFGGIWQSWFNLLAGRLIKTMQLLRAVGVWQDRLLELRRLH